MPPKTMSKNRIFLCIVLLFGLIVSIAVFCPSIQLSLIQEDREIIRVGNFSVTVNDVVILYSLFAGTVTIILLLDTVKKKK